MSYNCNHLKTHIMKKVFLLALLVVGLTTFAQGRKGTATLVKNQKLKKLFQPILR